VGLVLAYGSLGAGISKLQGYALAIDSPARSLGSITADTETHVSFDVQNLESDSVTILGAKTTCRCTTVSDLRLMLAPGEHAQLTIAVKPRSGDVGKGIKSSVLLYLDKPSRRLVLTVQAGVLPAPSVHNSVESSSKSG
jgi:hypothetical protein